ncbi:diguanylate cyclase [Pseudomonas putida]|nr:diguanylate cyclase [Pseudomonas putida]
MSAVFAVGAKPARSPVGAVLPANTGRAGALHRVASFAGMPAPTGPA